jgi:hypothetical protein
MEPIELATMNDVLQTLAKCESLRQEVRDACFQAATLLKEMREIILNSPSEDPAVEQLKLLLAQQGEG